MKVRYKYHPGDVLHIGVEGRSWKDASFTAEDPWGIVLSVHDQDGSWVGYELNWVRERILQGGRVVLPIEEPERTFHVEEAPGRCFNLSQLIEWIVGRAQASIPA